MKRLTIDATKAQELTHLDEFLSTLESGTYLASMFQGAHELAGEWIAQDVSFELLPALRRMNSELREQESRLRGEIQALIEKRDKLHREAKAIIGQVCHARDGAIEASKQMNDAANYLDRAKRSATMFAAEWTAKL